jgi:hypothetical protein
MASVPIRTRALYPPLRAPVYFTRVSPSRLRFDARDGERALGGFTVQTDELLRESSWLTTEIFLAQQPDLICTVRVAWIDELPDGLPARFDVGLQIAGIHPDDRQRLASAMAA